MSLLTGEEAYFGALKVIKETLAGIGVIRGTPCMLEHVEETEKDILLTFMWEETDGTRHEQDVLVPKPIEHFKHVETYIGDWVNGDKLYRKVIELDDPSLFQKGVAFKVCDLPSGFKLLTKGTGIIQTYENSYSNNDIYVYATSSGIMAKQNFTGYPKKLIIIIEYTK